VTLAAVAVASTSAVSCTGPKPPARLLVHGWVTLTLTTAQCRRVAKDIVAPPMEAPVIVANDRRVLARPSAGPMELNAADWPRDCTLVGPFATVVPGRETYTLRVGVARASQVAWTRLAVPDPGVDVTGAYARARAVAVPGSPRVPSPSPAPPPP
jgi:hypothetical protein